MSAIKVLLDTNILADWIGKRSPFEENAKKIVHACIFWKISEFVTSHSLTDLYYILRKDISDEERKQFISLICQTFTILVEDSDCFLDAMQHTDWLDFEDSLQMQCVSNANLDYIITRNISDFSSSFVNTIIPSDFVTTKL